MNIFPNHVQCNDELMNHHQLIQGIHWWAKHLTTALTKSWEKLPLLKSWIIFESNLSVVTSTWTWLNKHWIPCSHNSRGSSFDEWLNNQHPFSVSISLFIPKSTSFDHNLNLTIINETSETFSLSIATIHFQIPNPSIKGNTSYPKD